MSQQINLFSPIFLKQEKLFSARTMLQALGLIFFGAVALVLYSYFQTKSLGAQAAASATQLVLAEAQLVRVNVDFKPRQPSKAIEDEILKTESGIKSLQQVLEVLKKGEFGNTKGYAEYLRAFSRQILGGLWLTGFNIQGAGNEIGLQGRALQPELVPAYISRLKNERVMQGKSFSTLEMQLPMVDATGKQDQAANRPKVPAPYIEFNLHSSGLVKDASDATAGRSK